MRNIKAIEQAFEIFLGEIVIALLFLRDKYKAKLMMADWDLVIVETKVLWINLVHFEERELIVASAKVGIALVEEARHNALTNMLKLWRN